MVLQEVLQQLAETTEQLKQAQAASSKAPASSKPPAASKTPAVSAMAARWSGLSYEKLVEELEVAALALGLALALALALGLALGLALAPHLL